MFNRLNRPAGLVLACGISLAGLSAEGQTVYVSRMWHNHQPLYWPEWNSSPQNERVQYAQDSINLKSGQVYDSSTAHPENDLNAIFGVQDRINAYQSGPRNSLANVTSGGYTMSYSGSLIDNVNNLGANGHSGYSTSWWNGNREAVTWMTSGGNPKLDMVGFTYHHSLGPVLPKSVFRKELDIFHEAAYKAWDKGSVENRSRGFFPTEMAFSPTMIEVLADEGYEWAIVASHHLSRTLPAYMGNATYTDPENNSWKIFSSPPNRADQLGSASGGAFWFGTGNVGETAYNYAPYAYQLHKAQYVNPETGAESTIILVPSDDIQSYKAGYSGWQKGLIDDNINPYAGDSARPCLVMPATDGDNAWGGGSSSWDVDAPSMMNNGTYPGVAVQDFVDDYGAAADTVHIEDGAWIFPESDYGSPCFLKWVEPPAKSGSASCVPNTQIDCETPGFTPKFYSWAPVIAGANWCETAEQIWEDLHGAGSVAAWKIQGPYDNLNGGAYSSPNIVERAWHIYLCGLDSGFQYYGGEGNDDEVKTSLATRRAVELLQSFMSTNGVNDHTPPTVFKPQRFPWNPGAYTFGWFNIIPGDGNALKKMNSEFYIWTHAYDISGITNIEVKVRIDNDGVNTMANNQNEIYAGGSDVGSWVPVPMTRRVLPRGAAALTAAANNSKIQYFDQALSPEVADYYFVRIDDSALPGFRGKLLDYYIEAVDGQGNVSKSDIQHVFVEDDEAVPPGPPGQPTDVGATAISSTQITISWIAGSNAASYVVKRDGSEIDTTSATSYTDSGLAPSTLYIYSVVASNSAGVSQESASASATTQAPSQEFTMDGSADFEGYLVADSNMVLYAAIRGTRLYVATESPTGTARDHFILVSDVLLSSATNAAPWAKAGTVAVADGKPHLAGEGDSGWAGWFNAPGGSELFNLSGNQLEGSIDLAAQFGSVPPTVYLAALAYETVDGGALAAQAPAGNGDSHVDPNEFIALPVEAIRDSLANGAFDRLDPARGFRILEGWSGSNPDLVWLCVPGRLYQPEYCTNLGSGWLPLGDSLQAASGQDSLSSSTLTQGTNNPCFFRIRLE
ncbi:MAG: hypothetical protein JEZ10_04640 [Verrucomicrobia bacterium]|nr:hypothetical protein [Verrucomicrobiota bacterium]